MNHASRIGLFGLMLLASSAPAIASEFFVSPTGSDGDLGTLEKPFATIQRAQEAVGPGDTVSIRGGTYRMKEDQISRKRGIFADVTFLDRSGEPG